MKTKDLPNGIKELAERRLQEGGKARRDIRDHLVGNFLWNNTKEGHVFWSNINRSNFSVYEEKYSNHEWVGDYPGEYQVIADAYDNTIVAKVGYYVQTPFDKGMKFHEDVDVSSLTITPAVLANGYYAGEGVSQEIKDAWEQGYEYALNHVNLSDLMWDSDSSVSRNPPDVVYHTTKADDCGAETEGGVKEDDGKISFELDWEFIEAMAARMSKNKGKYPPYNWQKIIDTEKLKQALIRHVVEIMKGNYSDDGDEFGHLAAVALNTMMLSYQLKLKKDEV